MPEKTEVIIEPRLYHWHRRIGDFSILYVHFFFEETQLNIWNLTCLFKQKIGGILLSGECFLISKNEMSFWGWGRSRDIYMWEIFTHNNLHFATISKAHRSFSTYDAEFYARILLTYSKSFWYHEGTSKITLNYTQFLQFSGRIS